MARAKSEEKRAAILEAAVRVIVAQGLSAPTATIAREAGIANGSLFTYFATKSDLLNELYLDIKADMLAATKKNIVADDDFQQLTRQWWENWMAWAMANPARRRALVLLSVSDEILPATRQQAQKVAADLSQMMERVRNHGSFRSVPMPFVSGLVLALREATADAMLEEPGRAAQLCESGFQAFWRAIS